MKGFTLIELIIVIGILGILLVFVTPNLVQLQTRVGLDSVLTTLITDIKSQQIRSMIGDSDGGASALDFGIVIEPGRYTLFNGPTFTPGAPGNLTVDSGSNIVLSSSFPVVLGLPQVVFNRRSGEVSGFVSGQNTITLTNSTLGETKVLTINKYGGVTIN